MPTIKAMLGVPPFVARTESAIAGEFLAFDSIKSALLPQNLSRTKNLQETQMELVNSWCATSSSRKLQSSFRALESRPSISAWPEVSHMI